MHSFSVVSVNQKESVNHTDEMPCGKFPAYAHGSYAFMHSKKAYYGEFPCGKFTSGISVVSVVSFYAQHGSYAFIGDLDGEMPEYSRTECGKLRIFMKRPNFPLIVGVSG